MNELVIKQKESKPVRLIVTKGGERADLTDVTLLFQIKRRKGDATALVTKEDDDFNKTDAANGLVWFVLSQADTNLAPGSGYIGELQCTYLDGTVDKSEDIRVIVQQAVIME